MCDNAAVCDNAAIKRCTVSEEEEHCIVAHTGGSNLQLAAETCEFLQDPPLSMGL